MSSNRHAAALHRAVGLENDGALFEAKQIYKQLVRLPGGVDMAHYQYAQFLLRIGDYAAAWPHFMHRINDPVYRARNASTLNKPYWDATDPVRDRTQTILVYADQGIGDALMCARFLPLLAGRFAHVVFVVFVGFRELFSSLPGGVTVIEFGDPLPDFDVHVDLFSIPALLEVMPEDIPDPVCLHTDPDRAAFWHTRLDTDRLNIGLAWQGNPAHARDAERSAALRDFLPLLECGAVFHCLQVGDAVAQAEGLADASGLHIYREISESAEDSTGKMMETAALTESLDLVISVDTAVAHLAGVLGVPGWVLVSKVPDWRWMMNVDTSPWYPKTRIYRADARYDWAVPVARMRDSLCEKLRA